MADNFPAVQASTSPRNVATDQVTYSGDTADVQLMKRVGVTGAEGSKTVFDMSYGSGVSDAGTQRFVLATDVPVPAGENHLGSFGGTKVTITTSFTREANANPYTAGDVISSAATTLVPSITLAGLARVNAGTGYIVGAKVAFNVKSVVPRLRVYLYTVNTAVVGGDNLPQVMLYADYSKLMGFFDLPAMFTPADTTNSTASFTQDMTIRVPFACATATTTLYATLVALDAVTLTSGSAVTISLIAEQD
jgi:hypothetical protein